MTTLIDVRNAFFRYCQENGPQYAGPHLASNWCFSDKLLKYHASLPLADMPRYLNDPGDNVRIFAQYRIAEQVPAVTDWTIFEPGGTYEVSVT